MTQPIDGNRFEAILDAYGARPGAWPAGERAAMEARLAADPAAQAALEEAALLDYRLHAAPVFGDHARLTERAVAAAPRALRRHRMLRGLTAAGLGAALAVSAASGVAAGMLLAPATIIPVVAPTGDTLEQASTWMGQDEENQAG